MRFTPLPDAPGARRAASRRGPLLLALSVALAAVAGCEVGPDFHKPDAPAVTGYTPDPLPPETASAAVAGGETQRFLQDMDIPAQWWTLFHSPELNALVERSLKKNPTIPAAQAALKVALETEYAQIGAYLPDVDGSFAPSRNKSSNAIAPVPNFNTNIYSLYTAQLSLSYSPDLFGLNRRTVESLQAQAENQQFTLEATYLTLTSNVVAAAVQEASLRGQIAATEDIIKIERELLVLLHKQYDLGYAAGLDVAAQDAALAAAEASLPPLQKQLDQQRDLLAALSGSFPSDEPAERFELAKLQMPQDLPVTLPSKLVEQRPDVRASQALLQSASAQVGVAVANRLPNLTLSALWGTQAVSSAGLFAPGNGIWTLGANLTAPLFDGFTLLHKERAARAAFEQAAAQYQSTVLTAFQNVADSLRALQSDADALKAAVAAERAAKVSLDITRRQLELGAINYLSLLNAQQAYLQAVINLVQAQANRFADTAALFQALGGGWWNRTDRSAPEVATTAASQSPLEAVWDAILPWR
jgi:NodT family efflux transporter outer membrane factor (OMF) lipoprotein